MGYTGLPFQELIAHFRYMWEKSFNSPLYMAVNLWFF
jgi:hypothetical protein